jgi:hypothetical protein
VSELDVVVAEIVDEMRRRPDLGDVATYIPELAAVDPKQFGLAVITADGHVAAGGDSDTPFSIQSISKVFTLTLALGKVGDRLWRRVGREPSGSPFNSVVQLEYEHGIPRNPFINAGAIAVTDIILSGHQPREVLGEILRFVRFTPRQGLRCRHNAERGRPSGSSTGMLPRARSDPRRRRYRANRISWPARRRETGIDFADRCQGRRRQAQGRPGRSCRGGGSGRPLESASRHRPRPASREARAPVRLFGTARTTARGRARQS